MDKVLRVECFGTRCAGSAVDISILGCVQAYTVMSVPHQTMIQIAVCVRAENENQPNLPVIERPCVHCLCAGAESENRRGSFFFCGT